MSSRVNNLWDQTLVNLTVLVAMAVPLIGASADTQQPASNSRRVWVFGLSYNSYALAAENHIFMYDEDRTEEAFGFRCQTISYHESGLGLALGGEFQAGIVNRPFWGNPATESGAVGTELFAGPVLRVGRSNFTLHTFVGLNYLYIAGAEEWTPSGGGGIDINFYGNHGVAALWDKYLNDWVSGGERTTYPEIPGYSKFATLINSGLGVNLSERSLLYFDYVLRYDHGISHELRFGVGIEVGST